MTSYAANFDRVKFDRVNHDKLLEVKETDEIPELERRLIINLYWLQKASDVRSRDQVSSRDYLETCFRGLGLGLETKG